MPPFRALLATGAAAACVLGSLPAYAGYSRATSCNLLRDPSGDTQSVTPDNDAELDLVGGDIATNATTLTAVIRLATLTKEDVTEPAGRIYELDFTANGKNFILMGALLTGGSEFEAYISDQRIEKNKSGARAATGIGQMQGVLDLRHKELHLTAPLAIFKKYAPMTQTYLDHLAMFTYRAHGESTRALPTGKNVDVSSSFGIGVDDSYSKARYTPGAPSCVAIGR